MEKTANETKKEIGSTIPQLGNFIQCVVRKQTAKGRQSKVLTGKLRSFLLWSIYPKAHQESAKEPKFLFLKVNLRKVLSE
nr:MAG TPA: hypothetical protein [Caudoviricetes sp.]